MSWHESHFDKRPLQGWIQDFGQGASRVVTPEGAVSPKFAQNGGFSRNIAWKQHDCEQILGARGAWAPRAPWIRWCTVRFIRLCIPSASTWNPRAQTFSGSHRAAFPFCMPPHNTDLSSNIDAGSFCTNIDHPNQCKRTEKAIPLLSYPAHFLPSNPLHTKHKVGPLTTLLVFPMILSRSSNPLHVCWSPDLNLPWNRCSTIARIGHRPEIQIWTTVHCPSVPLQNICHCDRGNRNPISLGVWITMPWVKEVQKIRWKCSIFWRYTTWREMSERWHLIVLYHTRHCRLLSYDTQTA